MSNNNTRALLSASREKCDLPRYDPNFNTGLLYGYQCNVNVNPYCVVDFQEAWNRCSITSFPVLNFKSGLYYYGTWRECVNLEYFPMNPSLSSGIFFDMAWFFCRSLQNFPGLDLSSATSFWGSWYECHGLQTFPNTINLSSGVTFTNSWNNCYSLTSFPNLNLSSGVDFEQAWYRCHGLTSFPPLNLASGTNFKSAWKNCTSLMSFPAINFNGNAGFRSAWMGCSNLTTFPANMFDNNQNNNFTETWLNCALDQTSVDNILVSLDTSGTTGGSVSISGGTSFSPGTLGRVAKNNMVAKGWTVNTNPWWTPAEITTSLWLDAYDISSFVLGDTLNTTLREIDVWKDKSGNGQNVSAILPRSDYGLFRNRVGYPYTAEVIPLGLNPGLPLIGSTPQSLPYGSQPFSMFLLLDPGSSGTLLGWGNDTYNGSRFCYAFGEGGIGGLTVGSSKTVTTIVPPLINSSGLNIVSLVYSGGLISNTQLWANGVSQALTVTNDITPNVPTFGSELSVWKTPGTQDPQTYPVACTLKEIVVTPGAATTQVRQKIEGYLAWKWNIMTHLPSDHPYKAAAPLI